MNDEITCIDILYEYDWFALFDSNNYTLLMNHLEFMVVVAF